MKYYVYQHTRKDTNTVFYIGIGTKSKYHPSNPYHRSKVKYGRNPIWKYIVAKTEYSINILCEFENYDDALNYEKDLILKYGRVYNNTGCLANLSGGGKGTTNYTISEESRMKISNKLRGRKVNKELLYKRTQTKKTHVYQYDFDGNFVQKYFNIEECIEKNPSYYAPTVRAACLKLRVSAYGFQWRHSYNNEVGKYRPTKKVEMKTKEGELVGTYDSVKQCAKLLSLTISHIYTILKRKQFFNNYYLTYEIM